MNEPSPTPPIGDPEREAVASLRGYSYQMLRSIETWLELNAGEALVLEGAEDLDRIGPDGATVEQVKDTAGSGNITLRSKAALEAIGNFWEHLERNPGIPLRFRFLTTAGVGKEKDKPFGIDVPGLELWRSIQATPSDAGSLGQASAIQTFLASQDMLPGTIRDWLVQASPDAFVARIVLPMEWVTGWPDWAGLKETVEAKLIELCERRDIGSADALTALDLLHSEVWRVATSKGSRLLRRGDLLRRVDEAGTTAIPNAQMLAMMRALAGAATGAGTVALVPEPFGAAPRPAPRRHSRPELEGSIAEAFASGTVLIHGATGMGKTALARASLNPDRPVAWVDLRDLPPSAAGARIDAVRSRLLQVSRAHDVILDDLDAGGDARAMENALGLLRALQDEVGGRLLVTAPDRLSPRIATQLSLAAARVFPAPPFSPEDIAAYLVASGCPAGIADAWSKIIGASTSGHPQLVDARVAALAEGGFARPGLTDLLATPPEILDARAEARRIIAARPPDDRELLARASLLLGRTPRERLMAATLVEPAIAEPGHVIDRLTGPWLERSGANDLRPSPLLRNLGADTRGKGWFVAMHRGIAFTFLNERSLFATDVLELATHAMLGETAAPLISLMPSLLQAPQDVWTQIAETASVLVHVGVGEGTTSPFPREIDTAAFRVLQLRIAIESGERERIEAVLGQALREFDNRTPNHETSSHFLEMILLFQILQKPGDMPLADRLRLGVRFARIADDVRRTGSGPGDAQEWPDLTAIIPMALIPAITDVDDLIGLLDLLEGLDPEDRALSLAGFAEGRFAGGGAAAAMALDRVWLGEARRAEPRWAKLAAALERTVALGLRHGAPSLVDAAAPLLVRVTDENLRDAAAALARADTFIDEVRRPPRVLAAKAKVLMRSSRATEALPLYDEALSAFPLGLSWRTEAFRDAGVAAGRAEEWVLATQRLDDALLSLDEAELPVRRIGLLFDRAIALHLSGRTRQAVDCLGAATDLLLEDGCARAPEPLVSVRQLGSQAIRTITAGLRPDLVPATDAVDLRHVFGGASAMQELAWGDLVPASLDLFVFAMAQLDLLLPEPPVIAARLAGRLRASADLLVQAVQGNMLTHLAVRTLDVAEGARDAVREVRAMILAAAERDAGREVLNRSLEEDAAALPPAAGERVKNRLLARIIPLVATCRHERVPVERWRGDLPADEGMAEVHAMLDDFDRLAAGTEDAAARIFGPNPTWDRHLLAAVMAPIQRRLATDQLLVSHAVAARYLDRPGLSEFAGHTLSAMITDAWLERCDTPALLASPRVSVPAIRGAVTGTPEGWPRVTAVLRAAMLAVPAGTAGSVLDIVRRLQG